MKPISILIPFLSSVASAAASIVFLEAEQFADNGGWDLDQQSMDQMGSPYQIGRAHV